MKNLLTIAAAFLAALALTACASTGVPVLAADLNAMNDGATF